MKLTTELHAAYDWIDSAGEWEDAMRDPEQYARNAYDNYVAHYDADGELTESDLLSVIELYRRHH